MVTFSALPFLNSKSEKAEKIFMGGFGKERLLGISLFTTSCG